MIHSIPSEWRQKIRMSDLIFDQATLSKFDKVIHSSNVNKTAYELLISNDEYIIKKFTKWDEILQMNTTREDIQNICSMPYKATIDTKSRTLQYRIINRTLVTNKYLKLIGIKNCSHCTFCLKEEETIEHLFWACPQINNLWCELHRALLPFIDLGPLLSNVKYILFGIYYTGEYNLINTINLIIKRYIYLQRCRNGSINVRGAINAIKYIYHLEQEIVKYKNHNSKEKHNVKWQHLKNFMHS